MRLLLDTHAVIWFFEGNSRLSARALQAIETPEADVFVSAVSAIEITTKFRSGKLPNVAELALNFEGHTRHCRFIALPITLAHASKAGLLDFAHKDPFDRLLIAQSRLEGLTLVSNEALFDEFGVSRLW